MMTDAAPLEQGRRRGIGTVALMVAYLIVAPPLFLLGPLFLLLVLSRPTTGREWLWIALTGTAAASLALGGRSGLANVLLASAAALLSGSFAIVTHATRRTSTSLRAAAAVGLATVGLSAWAWATGISVEVVDAAVRASLEAALDLMFDQATPLQREAGQSSAALLTTVFPAVTALQAFAGVALASSWYHQVAGRPTGTPPRRFRDFRFNDHLVWGAIFTLAMALLALPAPWSRLIANCLVIWVGLYVARGLAVAVTLAARWPVPGRVLAAIAAVLAFPFATAGLITLGLMDTWIDIRGRLAASVPGGES